VGLDEFEMRVLDNRAFQRLRNVMQLGTSYLIYPSAVHSRFEHSLGTLQASSILFDRLVASSENLEILGWRRPSVVRHRRFLRVASLLHDVGHPPFSHAAEALLPGGQHHENFTGLVIRQTELRALIDKELGRGAAERVIAIATGTAVQGSDIFVSQLLTGDLGSDRLDYLARDSLHLGVAYGAYDLHRFVNGIRVHEAEPARIVELAIDDGAVHALEGILLARYFMFLQVYFHKTRRILDWHLAELLKDILPNGEYPLGAADYLAWDDHRVLMAAREPAMRDLAARLLGRRHLRVAYESLDHPEAHEVERQDWLAELLRGEFGDQVVIDRAQKDPYNYSSPPLQVLHQGGYAPIGERSVMVANLKPIDKMRVYTSLDRREDVGRFCREFIEERRTATGR
jgi:HD superfamily phosphohydrolase